MNLFYSSGNTITTIIITIIITTNISSHLILVLVLDLNSPMAKPIVMLHSVCGNEMQEWAGLRCNIINQNVDLSLPICKVKIGFD